MINTFIRYGIIIILLISLQLLLFNNIQFSGYINPYVYIMIVLLLPSTIPSWLLLIISFLTGLIIDLFMGSPGMHSSATLLAGFSRPYVHCCYSSTTAGRVGVRSFLCLFTDSDGSRCSIDYNSYPPYSTVLS
jgi:rod shape-determining protein MreD